MTNDNDTGISARRLAEVEAKKAQLSALSERAFGATMDYLSWFVDEALSGKSASKASEIVAAHVGDDLMVEGQLVATVAKKLEGYISTAHARLPRKYRKSKDTMAGDATLTMIFMAKYLHEYTKLKQELKDDGK